MDIKQGNVVLGSQEERGNYEPVESDLVESPEPIKVFSAFENHYSFDTIYIADIDSLENKGDNFEVLKDIFRFSDKDIMLDCGFSDYESFNSENLAFVDKFVVPTESLESLEELQKLVEKHSSSDFVVSIDLDEEGFISQIREKNVFRFLKEINKIGIDEVIILDVSQIGSEQGPSEQVKEIAENIEEIFTVVSGGGVGNEEDYWSFLENGVDKVLAATSLHEQSLDP